ncbi:hypothetical protein NC651_020174 [Populus alba x Populus x berolinensis]|nr:hypothetical protein NC651_020174 [Populus alba x Populus x berolinensis]
MVQVALSNSIKKPWNVWIDYTAVKALFNLLRKTYVVSGIDSHCPLHQCVPRVTLYGADVQNAIENENYAVAAGLRDEVSKLEAESFAASARAQAYENENAQYAFCLGQKVRHKIFVVPEENLVAPEKPDMERFDHPYTSFLFYGMETPGDFILIKQLREKHNKPRQS